MREDQVLICLEPQEGNNKRQVGSQDLRKRMIKSKLTIKVATNMLDHEGCTNVCQMMHTKIKFPKKYFTT